MDKNKYLKWLDSQMDIWLDKKLISETQRLEIRDLYIEEGRKIEILPLIIAVIGSALVGLGIILLLAKNWSNFSRPLKLLISIIPFLTGSICGFFILFFEKEKAMREAVGIFIPISVIAGLGLIGQTYHSVMPAESLYLASALISLPFVYLLNSSVASIAYMVLCCIYVASFPVGFMALSFFKALVLFSLIFPYILHLIKDGTPFENSWVHTVLIISGFISVIAITNESLYFMDNLILYGLIIIFAVDSSTNRLSFPSILGVFLVFIMFFIFTFNTRWTYWKSDKFDLDSLVMLALLFVPFMLLSYRNLKKEHGKLSLYFAFAIIPVISVIYNLIPHNEWSGNIVMWSFNLTFFLVAISIFINGSRMFIKDESSIVKANLGLILILAIISKWFFDVDISFLARGILFICLGITFLLFNFLLSKKRRGDKYAK
ncbi:MAG: DUF2157 domain-containing protein [Proteocatella sp.]